MSPLLLVAVAAVSAVAVVAAAYLMLRLSDTDIQLAARIDAARGTWAAPARGEAQRAARAANALGMLQQAVGSVGRWVMLSGLLPGRTRAELQQTLAASGFRSPNALALFLGSKLVLLAAMPAASWVLLQNTGFEGSTRTMMVVASGVVGLIAPDNIIARLRKGTTKRLEAGLPDALDLLVICAQAGLSLGPAMTRVVHELRTARPDVTRELDETLRELEMVADPNVALTNLGTRTGLDSLKRLGSTLVQTMQYGTPLSEALRSLSNELRQQMLTRFEERAARLPVLLTLPMIVFILPCLFIIVGGPAVLQVMKALSD